MKNWIPFSGFLLWRQWRPISVSPWSCWWGCSNRSNFMGSGLWKVITISLFSCTCWWGCYTRSNFMGSGLWKVITISLSSWTCWWGCSNRSNFMGSGLWKVITISLFWLFILGTMIQVRLMKVIKSLPCYL